MNRLFLLFAKAFCCIALCCIVPVSCGGGDVEIPPPPSTAPGGGDDNPDDDEPKPDPNPDPDEPTRLKIVDPQATDQTKALYSNLWAVASRGFMFGHHDDLWYGRYWYDVPGGSDTRAVCGDYPAVFSVDLAPIMDNRSDYESDRKENAIRRRVMLEAYGRGEVIVACCHLNNPLTGGDSWDNGNTGVVRAILDPQSPQHALYQQWLDRLADFALNLKGADGNLVPFIFRPYHEHTQEWPWWGSKCTTEQEFIDFWRMTVRYLRDTRGVHNLIYAISPQMDSEYSDARGRLSFRWPGDEWVDFIGMDCYHGLNTAAFTSNLKALTQFIEMYYNTHNKQTLESVCPIMNKGITPKYVESSSVLVINQACIHWDGQRLGNIKYHNEEIPVRKRILESGDVLLNATGNGTLGRCCVFICPSDNNTYINDGHVIALSTDRAVILPEVLNTYLSLNDTQAEIYRQYVTGSTNQVDIVFSDIKKMKVPVPSMDEQILFVEVLTQADKSEFVGCKSQFIEIFYGMETTPVKDYIDDSFPGEWGTEDKDGNGVKVIRTTNFTNSGKLNLADVVTRSIEDRKVVRKQIKKYDTILERSGGTADNPVGRVVLFEEDNLFLCNNFTQVLRFKDVDPRFAFYALYYFYQTNRTAIRSMGSKTTGIQNLNMSKYLEIGIPNASDEDQKAFVTIAEQADKSEYYN